MTPEKLAPTQHAVHELIRQRWSPRSFAPRPVEPEKLLALLEAASWAPSSNNQQPWRLIVTTQANRAEYDRLLGCLAESNQQWARLAPVLMVSVAQLLFDNGSVNRHAFHDVGAASENLSLQAAALGLCVHQMAGFDPEAVRSRFHVPDTYEPVAAIALGYLGPPDLLPPVLHDRELAPRSRKPISAFAFGGDWEQPLALG